MIAACNDGHGGESLYENLKNAKTPRELLDPITKVSVVSIILCKRLFILNYQTYFVTD